MSQPPLVFATERYQGLAQELGRELGAELGIIERQNFLDGERGLTIKSSARARDTLLVGGTTDDAATLELFDLAVGLVSLGANTLSLVVPYFGYSTQERATKSGEVVTAKSRALLLSAIPRARLTNEAIFLDLHTPGIQHYFEGHLHGVQLSAEPLVLGIVRQAALKGETVVACTDAGRAKWVQGLANAAGLPAAFVYKARKAGAKEGLVTTGVNADVKAKHVVIYDDLIRSGKSLLKAAEAYRGAGASSITGVTTHAVLPGDSLSQLRDSKLIDELYCTDSLPHVKALARGAKDFLKVLPVAPLIAAYFKSR